MEENNGEMGCQRHPSMKQSLESYRASDMHRSRLRQPIQMPPPLPHDVTDFQYVHFGVLGSKGYDRRRWGPEDVELGNGCGDGVCDCSCAGDNGATGFEVAAVQMEFGSLGSISR